MSDPNLKWLVLRAVEQAERALPAFERHQPNDKRPRQAIEAAVAWCNTGAPGHALPEAREALRNAREAAEAAAESVGDDKAHAAALAAAYTAVTALYACEGSGMLCAVTSDCAIKIARAVTETP